MAALVRGAFVSVGILNALVVSAVFFSQPPGPWFVLPSWLIAAVAAGLLVSELLLRLMRRLLEGVFILRYVAAVLGVSLGGILTGAFFSLSSAFFFGLTSEPDPLSVTLGVGTFLAFVGGILGFVEGVIFAFPLAATLGLFRDRTTSNHTENTS